MVILMGVPLLEVVVVDVEVVDLVVALAEEEVEVVAADEEGCVVVGVFMLAPRVLPPVVRVSLNLNLVQPQSHSIQTIL